jgi:hypothetical protein
MIQVKLDGTIAINNIKQHIIPNNLICFKTELRYQNFTAV